MPIMKGIPGDQRRWCRAFPPAGSALLFMLLLLVTGCRGASEEPIDLTPYQYRDTRNLVKFVYDASRILKRDGLKSLDYFRANRERYRTPNYYLYIYDDQGLNLFHAGMPGLEGKHLHNLSDINGRKLLQLTRQAIEDPANPHAWIHYSWWEPGKFYPVPKSSCHFRVTTPEGQVLYIGAGIDYPHEEKEFARIAVDSAVLMIGTQGMKALGEIADPTSSFAFRDVKVFAFYPDGTLLISPVLNESGVPLRLLEARDEVGNKTFADAVKRLDGADRVWAVFMAKNRYQRELVKKCLYLRRTTLDGRTLYVGAITDLPQPP